MGVGSVDVGEGFIEKQLILAYECTCLPRDEFLFTDLDPVTSCLALKLFFGGFFERETSGQQVADSLDLLDDEFKRHGY